MFWIGNWEFISWYGFKDPNSCLATYNNSQGAGENRNLGIEILPLHFWHHIGYFHEEFGFNNKRIWIGLGLISFFFDYYSKNKNSM